MYSITSILSVALQPALTTDYAIGTILARVRQGIVYNRKGA